MEKCETIIGDCRAVMEDLAFCVFIDTEMKAVSSEMEGASGLIQRLIDENVTRKLDQYDYRIKNDGYASWYAALESRMESMEKERERKGIQYDIFSGFLSGLSETGSCWWISTRSCSTSLWITQRLFGRQGGVHIPQRRGNWDGDLNFQ